MTGEPRRGWLLALETSTRRGSLALGRWENASEDGSDRTRDLDPELRHDRDLLPAIRALLAEAGLRPSELVGLVLGRGPGSFTGLRVGAATALGLHASLEVPVVGISSLEAIAVDLLATTTRVCVLVDARSESWFLATYARGEGLRPVVIEAPCLVPEAQLERHLGPGDAFWCEDEQLRSKLVERGLRDLRAASDGPRALPLLRLARTLWPPPPGTLEEQLLPLYLRRSTPEERLGAR